MAALVRGASITGLSSIFSTIHPWFTTTEAALQKKAFRILEEIFKRLTDKTVAEFFLSYVDEINNILDQVSGCIACFQIQMCFKFGRTDSDFAHNIQPNWDFAQNIHAVIHGKEGKRNHPVFVKIMSAVLSGRLLTFICVVEDL